jgi:hypothetical protein
MTSANAQGMVAAIWPGKEPGVLGLHSAASSSRHDIALHATRANHSTGNPQRVFSGPSTGGRDLALSVQ